MTELLMPYLRIPGAAAKRVTPLGLGTALTCLAVLFALIAGLGLTTPGVVVAAWLIGIPAWYAWSVVRKEDRRPVLLIAACAMVLRIALGATIFVLFLPQAFVVFDDAARYLQIGSSIAGAWRHGQNPDLLGTYQLSVAGYYYIVAVLDFVTGGNDFVVVIFNAAVAGISAVLVYQLANELHATRREALLGAAIASFMPSVLFWASIPLKDTVVGLIMLVGVVAALRLTSASRMIALLVLLVAMAALFTVRLYATLFLFGAGVGTILLTHTWRFRPIWAAVAIVTLALTEFSFLQGPMGSLVTSTATDVSELERQQTLFGGGGSATDDEASSRKAQPQAYSAPTFAPSSGPESTALPEGTGGQGSPGPATSIDPSALPQARPGRTNSLSALLARSPMYIVQFFVLPVPFLTHGQLVDLAIPEMFLWYAFLPAAAVGLFILARRRLHPAIVVVLVTLGVAFVYGTIVSNAGSLLRYRAVDVLLLSVPIASGLLFARDLVVRRLHRARV